MTNQDTNSATLRDELETFQASWNAKAPAGLQQKFEKGIDEIKEIIDRGLKAGDRAPDFELKNALNQPVKLSTLLNKGPVILSWYRGGWCPYCNYYAYFSRHKMTISSHFMPFNFFTPCIQSSSE